MPNPVIQSLLAHRSVRRYKSEPIPEATVRTIIEAGTRAATAGNLQLYSFLVLDDPDRIALIRTVLGGGIPTPPLVVIALVDLHRIGRWLRLNGAREPVMDSLAYLLLGLWDALIALQNVVVAAESLGLGTCYYGSIQEFDTQSNFETPPLTFPAGMITVGNPEETPPRGVRLPLDAVLHRNIYRDPDEETLQAQYGERAAIWGSVNEERRSTLRSQGIENLPQAIAVQRFSDGPTRARSQGVLENLRRAGFRLEVGS